MPSVGFWTHLKIILCAEYHMHWLFMEKFFVLTTLIYSHVIRAGHHFMFMFIHIFKVFFCLFEYSLWC